MQTRTLYPENLPWAQGIILNMINSGSCLVAEGEQSEFGSPRKIRGNFEPRQDYTPVCEPTMVCGNSTPGLLVNVGQDNAEIPVGSKMFIKGDTLVLQTNNSEGRKYFIAIRRA